MGNHVIDIGQMPRRPQNIAMLGGNYRVMGRYLEPSDFVTGRHFFTLTPGTIGLVQTTRQTAGYEVNWQTFENLMLRYRELNANVYDYMMDNPDSIPDFFDGKVVQFRGSVFSGDLSNTFFRCMYQKNGRWTGGRVHAYNNSRPCDWAAVIRTW